MDAALEMLGKKLTGLIDIFTECVAAGDGSDKSEVFCRKAVEVLSNNTACCRLLFNLQKMRRDLMGFDLQQPRLAHWDCSMKRFAMRNWHRVVT
ncbi:hypothetical protein LBW62_25415 [Ralstonia solanacearum]|uniref:hypothetical protein n=1 Tax=Ralstonia solanacearum TaxID=305 RepID=UPI001E5896E7|nr:hypothetical protein [Ralstonia solanacearum]MDB0544582.1 hypothetical protein [Ralstonia solanacearum]MDB0554389.1 hypothetical protein [Ralstonia solanacearum]MDB0559503.1 hypothetical protein [Ralstonia solanacearum]